MAQDHGPFGIAQRRRFAAMGIRQLGGLFDVLNQIHPGSGKALVRLRSGTAFNKGFNNASSGDFFTATIEDLLLQLSDQGIGLIGQLDRQLRHRKSNIYLICST